MKILRNVILCTLLFGSPALFAGDEDPVEAPVLNIETEVQIAPAELEDLGPDAERVLAKIQEHNNNCSREFAYGIFLRSLRDFTLRQPTPNKKRLSEWHTLGLGNTVEDFDLSEYKTLREKNRRLGPTERKKIYDLLKSLGINLPEYKVLEKHYQSAGDPLRLK